MNPLYSFSDKRIKLSGDVLSIRVIFEFAEQYEKDRELWLFLQEFRDELESQTKQTVRHYLGDEFEVRDISYHHGSLEILIVIGTGYYVISRYKNFVESIELLALQLKKLLTHFFYRHKPTPLKVFATWIPGPALVNVDMQFNQSPMESSSILLWYLVLSHAILLSVMIWMLVRR